MRSRVAEQGSADTAAGDVVARWLARGEVAPAMVVTALASLSAVLLIGRYAWRRRRAWVDRKFERDDILVLLFPMCSPPTLRSAIRIRGTTS